MANNPKQGRDAAGRFSAGNTFGTQSSRGKSKFNKEIHDRLSKRAADNQHADDVIADIAFDNNVDPNLRLKAAKILTDLMYGKDSVLAVDDEKAKYANMDGQQLTDIITEKMAMFNQINQSYKAEVTNDAE